MPTVAATAAAVNVQVKLEPSLSTGDIKLEQHTSDGDNTALFESEADIEEDEEGEVIYENNDDSAGDCDSDDDGDGEGDKNHNQRKWVCKHFGCSSSFKYASNRRRHEHEHRLQTELNMYGKTYTLTRQSLDDRWPCPVLDCTSALKSVNSLCAHLRASHDSTMGQQRQQRQQQQQQEQRPAKKTQCAHYFLDVDNFYVNDIHCGYHTTIGVFICRDCRLVPECLLTHLQQKHGYDEKLIDNVFLPQSALAANVDPNINQHTSNALLSSAINQPYQLQHQDIVQGWLCVTSDCGYCSYAIYNKCEHRNRIHHGEQLSTIPALVLRLTLTKMHTSCFLITRIDQANGAVTTSSNGHNGLNSQDENEDDVDQNETTDGSNQKKQWMCEYHNCGHVFNSVKLFSTHRREHELEVVINVCSNTFTLTRQSLDEQWTCPVTNCNKTCNTINGIHMHIRKVHSTLLKHNRANSEDEDSSQQQQKTIKKKQYVIQYLNVDSFYIRDTRCGYHTSTGLFMCHECRLVPECLLTHLQQKHGYDDKSIDNSALPDSAVNASADPNVNQHTSNPHIVSAIREPSQQHHQDIVQGWLCIAPNCGYCCSNIKSRYQHHYTEHRGEQQSTVPALVLQLLYGKTQTSSYLISRLDSTTSTNDNSNNSTNQCNNECDVEDDEDVEIELSDINGEDDIYAPETATVTAEPPPSQPLQNNPQPQPQPQPRPSQYNIFNMPLPDDPEFWRLVNNS